MTLWQELLGAEVRFVGGRDRARVLTAGAGAPVLLLHGQGGHLENFRHNIPAYAERWRVVAPDFVWHGLSAKPKVPPDLIGYLVEQIVDLLNQLDIDRCFIEGQSMGGWVATELALRYPDRVRALVLTTPMGLTAGPATADPVRLAAVRDAQLRALATVTIGQTRQRMSALFLDSSQLDDEIVALRTQFFSDPQTNDALRQVAERYFDPLLTSASAIGPGRLAQLNLPTLMYWGSANSIPPEEGRRIAAAIPECEWHCALAGHWAQYERWEEHNDVVTAFLARH